MWMKWIPAAAMICAGPALAQTPADSVTVDGAWARATPPHAASAAVYLTITGSHGADRLTGASTPVASAASVHESRMVAGVMQMRPVGALDVPAAGTVVLAPGGLHLMLTGLKAALQAGQHFPVTLRFDHAGAVTADVTVGKLGATTAPMPGMDMDAAP